MCKPTVTATFSYEYHGFTIRSYQFRSEMRYRIVSRYRINNRYFQGWDTTLSRCKDRCRVMLRRLGVRHLCELETDIAQ